MENSVKEIRQKEAFQAWKLANKRGTICSKTGFGKNRVFLMAVKELPETAKILFLAETKEREHDLKQEYQKWSCEGCAPVHFMCYQSAYKLKGEHFDLVCGDEIHEALTPIYSAFFFNNTFNQIICLSATIDPKVRVNPDDLNSIRKVDLLNKFAPICYKYTIDDANSENNGRKLNVFKIWHELDNISPKSVVVGTKSSPIKMSEYLGYQYCDNKFKSAMYSPENIRTFLIRNASAKRAELLYKLPSKIEKVKLLCRSIDGQSILFGNSLEALMCVTKNVISSKYSDKENEKIRNNFDSGKINLIGSFKKLKQGANLKNLDNCIVMSYYSKELHIIQQIGRLRDSEKEGNVFIFVTRNTQEEVWYKRMFENITSFKVKEFNNVEECINYLNPKKNDIPDSSGNSISNVHMVKSS